MDKYLITGFSGFVAKDFLAYLEKEKIDAHILGIDLHPPEFEIHQFNHLQCRFECTDLLNKDEVDKLFTCFSQPT